MMLWCSWMKKQSRNPSIGNSLIDTMLVLSLSMNAMLASAHGEYKYLLASASSTDGFRLRPRSA